MVNLNLTTTVFFVGVYYVVYELNVSSDVAMVFYYGDCRCQDGRRLELSDDRCRDVVGTDNDDFSICCLHGDDLNGYRTVAVTRIMTSIITTHIEDDLNFRRPVDIIFTATFVVIP